MTTNQKLTAAVSAAAVVLLLAYDTWAVLHGGTDATISWVLWTQSHEHPAIPFFSGCLVGHLFLSQ